jgi:hypothetical protein
VSTSVKLDDDLSITNDIEGYGTQKGRSTSTCYRHIRKRSSSLLFSNFVHVDRRAPIFHLYFPLAVSETIFAEWHDRRTALLLRFVSHQCVHVLTLDMTAAQLIKVTATPALWQP